MTTITTGTSGPQAWKIALVAAALGLATLVVVSLPQTSDTTGQQATESPQAVIAESPRTRSFFDENQATGRTPALPDSVTGFEYGDETTPGKVSSPGVTTQYTGNSGELFPYENGSAPQVALDQARIDLLAPVITHEFLDGPSSASQGVSRVDPRAAAAAGLNPGEIDAIVGGTTAAAAVTAPAPAASDEALVNPVSEINAAQMIAEMIASERPVPAPAPAASDEALVNPVSEINAAQMIAEMIASERPVPAPVPAASDEALVRGDNETRAAVDWDGLGGPSQDSTVGRYYTSQSVAESAVSPEWQAYVDSVDNGSAGAYFQSSVNDPLIDERAAGDPYLGGVSDDVLTVPSTRVDSADIKYLESSPEPPPSVRVPQQNVSMR